MHDTLLQTPRIRLRRLVRDDLDDLAALDSDPDVMRFINGGVPVPRETIESELWPRWLAVYEKGPGRGFWIACDPVSAGFLGWFHIKPGHYWPEEIEIGYRLRRELWGRGLATEGTRAIIAYSFDTLGEPKVHATTMRGNAASRRVMEKSGMEFEREFAEERWPGGDKRGVKYSAVSWRWNAG